MAAVWCVVVPTDQRHFEENIVLLNIDNRAQILGEERARSWRRQDLAGRRGAAGRDIQARIEQRLKHRERGDRRQRSARIDEVDVRLVARIGHLPVRLRRSVRGA